MYHAGADETKLTREALKWPYGEFEIPGEVYDAFGAAGKKGQALEDEWNKVRTHLLLQHALLHQYMYSMHVIQFMFQDVFPVDSTSGTSGGAQGVQPLSLMFNVVAVIMHPSLPCLLRFDISDFLLAQASQA